MYATTSILGSTVENTGTIIKPLKTAQKSDRPHICIQCSKAFKMGVHLREHVQVVHEKRRHKCNLCARSFCVERKLRKHLIDQHHPSLVSSNMPTNVKVTQLNMLVIGDIHKLH